jgi:hypothetical protein
VVEIDEGIGGPDCFAQIITGDDLAGIPQQRAEDLKRLFL